VVELLTGITFVANKITRVKTTAHVTAMPTMAHRPNGLAAFKEENVLFINIDFINMF